MFWIHFLMSIHNMYEILGTGFRHWIQYGDMNAHQEYMQLGTQFGMEVRMPTKNIWSIRHWILALDSVWRYECPLRISDTRFGHWIQYGDMNAHSDYQMLDSGTGFSMEIWTPTQNVYEILGTGIRHSIQDGDKDAHSEYAWNIEHWIQALNLVWR